MKRLLAALGASAMIGATIGLAAPAHADPPPVPDGDDDVITARIRLVDLDVRVADHGRVRGIDGGDFGAQGQHQHTEEAGKRQRGENPHARDKTCLAWVTSPQGVTDPPGDGHP